MARRLLTVSRKECFEPIALNVNSVIERLQSMIRRVIGREIELHLELAPHIGQFNANPGEIEQLVMNLVINARDAMESGGRLTISTRDVEFDRSQALPSSSVRPGRYVALQVSDTGCGMDDVVKQQIFEPFFTTKAADKGTGIGLSTVRDIVSRCHGHIRVQSHAGQGATFELLFPSAANGLECWVVESEPQLVSSGTETVLLVDDEPAVRRLISLVLKARGYAVIESESPADAIALCKKSAGKVDLLITDLIMPGMNGLELATNILNDRPNVKVLSISAYSDVGSPSKGFQFQDWPFLQKPFTSHELATKVRQALDAQV
jgi:two-component system cell cycle sensor histidine kinase/response regulator CckA